MRKKIFIMYVSGERKELNMAKQHIIEITVSPMPPIPPMTLTLAGLDLTYVPSWETFPRIPVLLLEVACDPIVAGWFAMMVEAISRKIKIGFDEVSLNHFLVHSASACIFR